ncbi:PspA/IM30 family protein [Nostoc sp. PCC 7107]|uniref:PspA/IM30 family protein n=1 Tax=Nostoc sp. PCC 7107 TaxID=317936 RepID=UPI00029EED85|nr:PspA/IM30 family protein [Nostoc sp. PCC 7107]AFY41293.1 phage shock protein A (PspA) family protein [Nostoc sp. PCC 7107]
MDIYGQNDSRQNALNKLREGTIHASAAQKIAQRDYAQAQAQADKWTARYQLALQEGREDLIPQAKFQKERYQAIASRLKNLVEEQQPKVENLKVSFKSWEEKISEADNNEKQVLQVETNSEVVSNSDRLIFRTFEDVDEELQRLKKELLQPSKQLNKATDKQDAKTLLAVAIGEVRQTLNFAVTHQEGIQKDYEKAKEEVTFWKNKAQIALKNNDDNLAVKAVLKNKVNNKIVFTLKTQLQKQEITVNLLKQNLTVLENILELLET